MLEAVEAIDEYLLLLINGHHNLVWDRTLWIVSARWTWLPLYLFLTGLMIKKFGWSRTAIMLICIALTVGITDYLCASMIRPAIGRLRPSNPDNPISALITLVYDYQGGLYGFPSCHAANSMALAILLAMLIKSRITAIAMIGWSLTVGYSRVYLGVHYPSDVLGGWLIGALISGVMYAIYITANKYIDLSCNSTLFINGQQR